MVYRPWLVFMVLLLSGIKGIAQDTHRIGTLPHFNLTGQLADFWKLSLKIESRQINLQGDFIEKATPEFKHVNTDLQWLVSYSSFATSSLSAGYLIRLTPGSVTHRLLQQYSTVTKHYGFRLAHRIASDQTFHEKRKTEWRFRYRIGLELALEGLDVDPGEFYFKITNEYLGTFIGSEFQPEIRLTPNLGYSFTDQNKLEFGVDYRVDSIFDPVTRHSFWITLGWFLKV
jgi:hypothetical protein